MSKRFINCTACKGCHTGGGGRYCPFLSPDKPTGEIAGTAKMAEAAIPDRESPEYEAYLAQRIEEEEIRLKSLQDKCRITSMEEQLASLRLQSAELTDRRGAGASPGSGPAHAETGIAGQLLSAARKGAAGNAHPVNIYIYIYL